MATSGQKVNIYTGLQSVYDGAVAEEDIDSNGIYFIQGESSPNRIYVGEDLYADVSSLQGLQFDCYACRATSAIALGDSILVPITQWGSEDPPILDRIKISAKFINGLRCIDEFNAALTVSSEQTSGVTTYYPAVVITPNYTYTDTSTEFIVDLIRI